MDSYILTINRKGISLVELALSLAIMATLAFTLIRLAGGAIVVAQHQRTQCDLQAIAQACRNYQIQHGQWPVSMNDLTSEFLSPTLVNITSYQMTVHGQLLKISNTLGQLIFAQPYAGTLARLDYHH